MIFFKNEFFKIFQKVSFSKIFQNFPKIWEILGNFLPKNVEICSFLHRFCTSLADTNRILEKNDVKSTLFEKNFFSRFLRFFRAPKQKKVSKKWISKQLKNVLKVAKTGKTPFFAFLAFFPIF